MTQIINITPNSRDAEFVALTNSELYLELKRIREALESLKAPAATPSAPDTPTATAAPEQTPSAPNPETAAQIQQLEARLNEVLTQLREQAQTLEDKPDEQAVINLFNKAVQNLPKGESNSLPEAYAVTLEHLEADPAKSYEMNVSENTRHDPILLPENFPLGPALVSFANSPAGGSVIEVTDRILDIQALNIASEISYIMPLGVKPEKITQTTAKEFSKTLHANKIREIAASAKGKINKKRTDVTLYDFEILVTVEDEAGEPLTIDGTQYLWDVSHPHGYSYSIQGGVCRLGFSQAQEENQQRFFITPSYAMWGYQEKWSFDVVLEEDTGE